MVAGKGSRPMSLVGPYDHERARLDGTFTDLDREWRQKWIKSQELSHHEPRPIPEQVNPIKRAFRFPLDFVFSKLEPVFGKHTSSVRYATGKYLIALSIVFTGMYYLKYNSHDWTRKKGWAVYSSRSIMYPGDPNFPNYPQREASDYADYGFKKSGF